MEENKDCCEVWSVIAVRFDWMKLVDEPEFITMPHINEGGNKWFVNFCPACGSPARNRIMRAKRLLTKRAPDGLVCTCDTNDSSRPWFLHALDCPANARR